MCQTKYSKRSYKLMKAFQQDELNSAAIYAHFAHCDKDKKNCKILQFEARGYRKKDKDITDIGDGRACRKGLCTR